jgi:hypothetical protein
MRNVDQEALKFSDGIAGARTMLAIKGNADALRRRLTGATSRHAGRRASSLVYI